MSCNLATSTAYSYSLFQYVVVRYSINSDLVAKISSEAKRDQYWNIGVCLRAVLYMSGCDRM